MDHDSPVCRIEWDFCSASVTKGLSYFNALNLLALCVILCTLRMVPLSSSKFIEESNDYKNPMEKKTERKKSFLFSKARTTCILYVWLKNSRKRPNLTYKKFKLPPNNWLCNDLCLPESKSPSLSKMKVGGFNWIARKKSIIRVSFFLLPFIFFCFLLFFLFFVFFFLLCFFFSSFSFPLHEGREKKERKTVVKIH